MTLFRALPVRRGDACLLKSRRGTYLVDGGDLSGELPAMLRERRVGKLRAAVCTFPSPERLGGILDLLAAGYPVKECWLPARLGILERMACRFNGDWPGWLSLMGSTCPPPPAPGLSETKRHAPAAVLIGLAAAGCPGGPVAVPSLIADPGDYVAAILDGLAVRAAARWRERGTGSRLPILARALFRGGAFRELAMACCGLIMEQAKAMPAGNARAKAVRGLTLAALASVLTEDGPRVRFFRNSNDLRQHLVARHPMVCLNGAETDLSDAAPPAADPETLFREAGKMFENGHGLAYRFGDGACGVLFCGNSRLSFAGTGIPLRQPSVITAPGQGGIALEEAYARVDSDDPHRDIWVRTHYSYARRISNIFKRLPNKLCLNNCKCRSVQEVALEFDGHLWNRLAGRACICD